MRPSPRAARGRLRARAASVLRPAVPRARAAREPGLAVRHAVALGLVQGPAELLPVSSSGHLVLIPPLLGWPYALDPAHRKAFEVALHAGTAIGLTTALRGEVREVIAGLDGGRVLRLLAATLPATAAGLFLHTPIVERLSAPRSVAYAQIAGGAALWIADRRPADRAHERAPLGDALAVGLAQVTALAPGVSRGGAALTALRLRHVERRAASEVSRHAAAPIVLGAAALEAARAARRPPPAELALPFAAGAAAACASTVAAAGLARAMDRAHSYVPLAAYRIALGAYALRRLPRRTLEWRP